VLTEDIIPALEKLRKEKVQYQEWQSATANLDRLRRFCVAFRYVEAQRVQKTGEDEVSELKRRIDEVEATLAQLDVEMREKEDEVKGLQVGKRA
jgi:structural maintenance of chromosome 2